MLTFFKAQVASLAASAVDYVVTIVLVQLTGTSPMLVSLASVEGAISGGLVNFSISRFWVFQGGQHRTRTQLMRYLMIWTGSVLLNATGMYLLTYFTLLNYAISKIFVSVLVGMLYNYYLQKKFVFK